MRNMLKFLKELGANVCLVRTPHPPTFRRLAKEGPMYKTAPAAFASLARMYGARHIDRWNNFDSDDKFWDDTHLGPEEGRLFGKQVYRDCFGCPE